MGRARVLSAGELLLAVLAWYASRWLWWSRVHYHRLWGRSLPREELRTTLLELLAAFEQVLAAAGIPWWLDAGTLLGAHREGGLIAWDDDLDVGVLARDHARLLAAAGQFPRPLRLLRISRWWPLDKLLPGLARWAPGDTFLRLLHEPSGLYVDVFEMAETAGDRLRMLPLSAFHPQRDFRGAIFEVARGDVFPLTTAPFEGRARPAPRRTLSYLQAWYGEDLTPDHELDVERGCYVPRRPLRGGAGPWLARLLWLSAPPRRVPIPRPAGSAPRAR
ncbi:MAG: LicD family protein [Vicinamibacteria bacterium]|nr:LicD family protein [Vicinamibacteria bacterium]